MDPARGLGWSGVWLGVRSLAWTVLLPGSVAGYVPWRFFGLARVQLDLRRPVHGLGLLCIGLGVVLLGTCIWEFARTGRGTLAPVDPPQELVVRGLYRYVRNPMYLSVTLIVLGEFLLTWSRSLLVYWACFFVAANLFVIGYEEPTLRRRFGAAYERYTKEVGRWLPRLRARKSSRHKESTMRAYLITTGSLFALLALVHVWRIIAEWPLPVTDAGAAFEAAIGVVAAALAYWAWRLLLLTTRS